MSDFGGFSPVAVQCLNSQTHLYDPLKDKCANIISFCQQIPPKNGNQQ